MPNTGKKQIIRKDNLKTQVFMKNDFSNCIFLKVKMEDNLSFFVRPSRTSHRSKRNKQKQSKDILIDAELSCTHLKKHINARKN